MKTLVKSIHGDERKVNGSGGCFARWQDKGLCPGVRSAEWLNSLPDDEELMPGLRTITCGQVRHNWLKYSKHITRV